MQLPQGGFIGVLAPNLWQHCYEWDETAPSRLLAIDLKINKNNSKHGVVTWSVTISDIATLVK